MPSDFSIRHAASIIRQGGILAYPTDTIYGLGCDPYNPDAVNRLSEIKHRPLNKLFILLAADIDQLKGLIDIDTEQQDIIATQKSATSWIISASKTAPEWLTDNDNNITIRISQNLVVQKLCRHLGHAIISSSANLTGKTPAQNSLQIHKYFHATVDKILATNKKLTARPSTIIRLSDHTIIRE